MDTGEFVFLCVITNKSTGECDVMRVTSKLCLLSIMLTVDDVSCDIIVKGA